MVVTYNPGWVLKDENGIVFFAGCCCNSHEVSFSRPDLTPLCCYVVQSSEGYETDADVECKVTPLFQVRLVGTSLLIMIFLSPNCIMYTPPCATLFGRHVIASLSNLVLVANDFLSWHYIARDVLAVHPSGNVS